MLNMGLIIAMLRLTTSGRFGGTALVRLRRASPGWAVEKERAVEGRPSAAQQGERGGRGETADRPVPSRNKRRDLSKRLLKFPFLSAHEE